MTDDIHGSSRLPAMPKTAAEPVYVTRYVGACLTGVNHRTFARHAKPSAWRLENDGGLSPLYDLAAVEAFSTAYQPETADGAE